MKLIATWKMSLEPLQDLHTKIKNNYPLEEVLEELITAVENNELVSSVGYGGLPNKEGVVQLDAAYMDGSTLDYGAVGALEGIKNPFQVAYKLSKERNNNVLVGEGALRYALANGFEKSVLLSENSSNKYLNNSHDTVCAIGLDNKAHMAVGVSTSGLAFKHCGRLGDSPIIGSGFYVDSEIGGAAATGLGEDIMRGVLSYRIVAQMEEGLSPQEACERVLRQHLDNLKRRERVIGDISLIALDRFGNIGAATTLVEFPFIVADEKEVAMYVASYDNGKFLVTKGPCSANYQGD